MNHRLWFLSRVPKKGAGNSLLAMRLLETSGDWVAAEERKASLAREGAFMSEVCPGPFGVYRGVFNHFFRRSRVARQLLLLRCSPGATGKLRRYIQPTTCFGTAAAPAPAELDAVGRNVSSIVRDEESCEAGTK